ncbi:PREDICTED: odorant receptor Or2-like [Dinoponera quadriceps]|uniref:Odorant receptor Or2-like n=1 Tax=Dinoponera quadriceps TaxID=609295 RepID=A0A6P3WPI8_DINQU|nr:PREDICTED: odorant receptor Or2-like [Dinoponera quadriceps]
MSLIRVWGDMILMIDNLQFTLPLLITILKVSIMWSKKEALMPLIDMITKDWIKTKIEEERNVMLQQARISRIFTMCGGLMILSTLVIGIVLPYFGLTLRQVTNLTDPGKPLSIQSYYIYDVSKSPQYELTFLMQGIGQTLSGFTYTAVDTFLGSLILHICGQMKNLQTRLANLGKNTNYKVALKYNVKDHIRLIRSIQIIDNTFHLMLLGLFFLFGVLFCLQGFLIVNVINQGGHLSVMQLIWFLAASVCVLLHMCLYCVAGEFLVTQSEKMHRTIYESEWYIVEPQLAKDLILIMLRANKPLYVTAGKTFPLTMATFCSLLKTSAGYISVLLANRD